MDFNNKFWKRFKTTDNSLSLCVPQFLCPVPPPTLSRSLDDFVLGKLRAWWSGHQPVQVSDCQVVRWIFPAPGTEGVAFCGVVLIFPTPPRKSHLERDSALFRWIFPKDENSIIITPLHRSWRHREGGMWLKSVPSKYRRADLPSVRIVLLKYAELLVLSIAALHYKRNHSSKGSRKFWIWAGDALFAGVIGGVNRELNWFKLNQSYRLRKVGCLPARDMLVRD